MRKLRRQGGKPRAAVVVPNTTLFYAGVAARIRQEILRDYNLWAIVRLPKGVFEPYTDIETNILFFEYGMPSTKILFYKLSPPNDRKQYSKTQPLRYDELQECLDLLIKRDDSSPNAWFIDSAQVLSDPKALLDIHNPKAVRATNEHPAVVVQKLHLAAHQIANSLKNIQNEIQVLEKLVTDQTKWSEYRLDNVLKRRKDVCDVEDGILYKRLRIQVKGRGVKLRDECDGSKIGTKRQFIVHAGQFVLSKIDARYGAFGIVPEEADEAIITGNFWAYDVDTKVIEPKLLHYLTRSDAFINFCSISSPGATNRRYLQENLFLTQVVRIPLLPTQQAICNCLEKIEAVSRIAERDLMVLSKRSPALLQSALHTVFGGEARILDDETSEGGIEDDVEHAEVS